MIARIGDQIIDWKEHCNFDYNLFQRTGRGQLLKIIHASPIRAQAQGGRGRDGDASLPLSNQILVEILAAPLQVASARWS